MLGSMLVPLQASRVHAGPQALTVWQMYMCSRSKAQGNSHDSHNVGVPELGAGLYIAQNLQDGCKHSSGGGLMLQSGCRHASRWLLQVTRMLTLLANDGAHHGIAGHWHGMHAQAALWKLWPGCWYAMCERTHVQIFHLLLGYVLMPAALTRLCSR